MGKNQSLELAIKFIREAILKNTTVRQVSISNGKGKNYVYDVKERLKDILKNGVIDQEDHDEFVSEWERYEKNKHSNNSVNKNIKPANKIKKTYTPDSAAELSQQELSDIEYDAEIDDNYDDRSSGEVIRGDETIIDVKTGLELKKINSYKYSILIKGEHPLEGELSREEMNKVYRLYSNLDGAGLTLRAVTREFPSLTYRDFKRILRAFNITKQSIPVAPHIIEESTEQEVVDIVFRNKENNILKKIDEDRGRQVEKHLRETQQELIELKKKFKNFQELISDVIPNSVETFEMPQIEIPSGQEKALVVYLSDQHVGALTDPDSLYKNHYDAAEFERRLKLVIEGIHKNYLTHGRFEKIIICSLGDCLDGYEGHTTRGGHGLPQNLNTKQQFTTYVTGMQRFFGTLITANLSNEIEFQCVGDDNHAGPLGYMANKTLEMYLNLVAPNIKTKVFEKFIEYFNYGSHTYIMCHGKDKEDMKHGFGLFIDTKIENYFNDYIAHHEIFSPNVHVVSGDLHQSATSFAKRFRYKKVGSMYGGSKWIHTNFGTSKPCVDYEIVNKHSSEIMEGRLWIKN